MNALNAAVLAVARAFGFGTTDRERVHNLFGGEGPIGLNHRYPYPRVYNTGAAAQKRAKRKRMNVRARSAHR